METDHMKILTLSDHAADQLNASAARRTAQYEEAIARYHHELGQIEVRKQTARNHLAEAWRQRNLIAVAGGLIHRLFLSFTTLPSPPEEAPAGREETVWVAGRAGEPPLPVERILQLIRKDHEFQQSPSVHRFPGRAQA
jgi:hypothetical protein